MYDQNADDDLFSGSKLPITKRHFIIAAALGSTWFFVDGSAFFPLGVLIALVWIGRSFDVTFGRSVKHGWKVVGTAMAASAVGLVATTGPLFHLFAAGKMIGVQLGGRIFSSVLAVTFTL